MVALHQQQPDALAYLQPGAYGFKVYTREHLEGQPYTLQPTHTREKGLAERSWWVVCSGSSRPLVGFPLSSLQPVDLTW